MFIVAQWKNVRKYQTEASILEKQIEMKKISLVEKDMESKRILENVIPLPKDQQDKLAEIRSSTSKRMSEIGFLQSEISERLSNLEAQTEYMKLQKMLKDLDEKEKKLNKR